MNRRSLIQALGLAPLAAFLSGKAEAASKPIVDATTVWNERKLFTMTFQVPKLDLSTDAWWTLGQQAPLPFFKGIEKVVHASTRTPDVRDVARLAYYDKSGAAWGPTYEEFNEKFMDHRHYEITDFMSMSELFVHGAYILQRHVEARARQIIEMSMVPLEIDPESLRPYMVTHMERLRQKVSAPGVFEDVLSTLGSINLSFFYYGPAPYPVDKGIHTFDHETGTWQPLRRQAA